MAMRMARVLGYVIRVYHVGCVTGTIISGSEAVRTRAAELPPDLYLAFDAHTTLKNKKICEDIPPQLDLGSLVLAREL